MLLWLLIPGVPLQGFASVRYMDAACPMMAAASAHAMDHGSAPATDHFSAHDAAGMADEVDCHDHDGDASQTGNSCPAEAGCHATGAALLNHCRVPALVSVAYRSAPPAWLKFQSHDPPLLLRPPAHS